MNEEMFQNLSDMLEGKNNISGSTDNNNSNTINSNLEDNFQNIFSNFTSNSNNSTNNNSGAFDANNGFDFSNIDMATIMKIKNIMSKMNSKKEDPKSNLLTSLKPYLRDSKKENLDKYMKIMNLTSVMEVFNNIGGDSIK